MSNWKFLWIFKKKKKKILQFFFPEIQTCFLMKFTGGKQTTNTNILLNCSRLSDCKSTFAIYFFAEMTGLNKSNKSNFSITSFGKHALITTTYTETVNFLIFIHTSYAWRRGVVSNLSLLQSPGPFTKKLQLKVLPILSFESHQFEGKETWREEEGDLPRVDKEHNKSRVFVAKLRSCHWWRQQSIKSFCTQ